MPVNPFVPDTDTEKAWLTPPIVPLTRAGVTDKLKSCAAVMLNFNCAECVNDPLVPLTVIVKSPTGADAGIATNTFWLPPAAIVIGDAGVLVLPAGNPAKVTATEPANPFSPAIKMPTFEVDVPAWTVVEVGVTVS
jgi:hypothetical protein